VKRKHVGRSRKTWGARVTDAENEERLRLRFQDVLSQLLRSANDYDAGHRDEGRRMALAIRLLVHDTGRQTSLLRHLKLKDRISYYDTQGSHLGLLSLVFAVEGEGVGDVRIDARLDQQPSSPKSEMQPFDPWWTTPVIRDESGNLYSRSDIVLFLADQDGGAHVDLKVSPELIRLTTGQAVDWRKWSPERMSEFIDGIELAIARQVAHELLVTLARQTPESFADPDIARRYASEPVERPGDAASITDARVYPERADIGRNDFCWCGSMKKYKKCHGSVYALGRREAGKQPWPPPNAS